MMTPRIAMRLPARTTAGAHINAAEALGRGADRVCGAVVAQMPKGKVGDYWMPAFAGMTPSVWAARGQRAPTLPLVALALFSDQGDVAAQ